MSATGAQAVCTLLRSLAGNFRRFFAEGVPLVEPIDLYPEISTVGPSERRAVLETLVRAASRSQSGATVMDLRQATRFPDAMLRNALDRLGKERLVRVEVHTLSRRFSLRPRHELRFHITQDGCSHFSDLSYTKAVLQCLRPDGVYRSKGQSS